MNYRTVELLPSGDTVSASGTKTIDINLKDIISRIMIYWQISLTPYGMDSYQHRDITKIEIVDGSDVLWSMNGGQCQALCLYDRKSKSMNYKQKFATNSLASNYGIDFGRFLHDPMLALDPTRFRNLQLKISYNEALCDTGASENELGVIAEVFDEKAITPVGFLSAKEVYNALSPSSGYTYIDLPTDHVLRKLLVQGYLTDIEPWATVANVRLDEDQDKRVVFDWNTERYYRMMLGIWTPVEDDMIAIALTGGTKYYVTPTDYYAHTVAVTTTPGDYQVQLTGYGRGGGVTLAGVGTNVMFYATSKGYLPNHCIEFPMGDPKDIEDWYDVTKVGALRLRLNAGGSGGSGQYAVVTQQLRKY